jgi:magnesium-transporting ATPase (P-type)
MADLEEDVQNFKTKYEMSKQEKTSCSKVCEMKVSSLQAFWNICQMFDYQSQDQLVDGEKDLLEQAGIVYTAEVSKLAAHFKSSTVNGLSEEVVASRLKQHEHNVVELNKKLSLWIQFIRCFCIYFSPLLWIATILTVILWLVFPLRFISNYYLVVIILLLLTIVATGLSLFWRVGMLSCRVIIHWYNLIDSFLRSTRPL